MADVAGQATWSRLAPKASDAVSAKSYAVPASGAARRCSKAGGRCWIEPPGARSNKDRARALPPPPATDATAAAPGRVWDPPGARRAVGRVLGSTTVGDSSCCLPLAGRIILSRTVAREDALAIPFVPRSRTPSPTMRRPSAPSSSPTTCTEGGAAPGGRCRRDRAAKSGARQGQLWRGKEPGRYWPDRRVSSMAKPARETLK